MSMSIDVFFKGDLRIDIEEVAAELLRLGLRAQFTHRLADANAFWPFKLNGVKVGCEVYRSSADEVTEFRQAHPAIGLRDHGLHLVFHGEDDLAAASAVAAALVQLVDAVAWGSEEGHALETAALIAQAKQIVARAKKKVPFKTTLARHLKPICDEYPAEFVNGVLFLKPIGLYLRGVTFQKSSYGDIAYVSSFVRPLFAFAGGLDGAIYNGFRHSVPGPKYNQGWEFIPGSFRENFDALMRETIMPLMGRMSSGTDMDRYIEFLNEQMGTNPTLGRMAQGFGWAHLHKGNLEQAREIFSPFLTFNEQYTSPITLPIIEGLRNIIKLIETNPAAIPQHCTETARQAIIDCKLQKYWEPTEFVFGSK
jgi:hypothetical protein